MRGHLCFAIASVIMLFCGCAQIVPLTGGERDTKPPVLIQAVPPAQNVNFSGRQIVLRFNEYVQLKDPANQVLLSPRPSRMPEIKAEGKTVVVRFAEGSLKPGTTYRLNFGNAIADMNESNSISGFSYVFSTGLNIDSLTLGGEVLVANNNMPQADVLVGLYPANDSLSKGKIDSLPMIMAPAYATRTDQSGNFLFSNLPTGTFHVFATKDNNRNNLYEPVAERVAFTSPVTVGDSTPRATLRLFQEVPAKLFVKRAFSPFYGFAQIELNKPSYVEVKALRKGELKDLFLPVKGQYEDTIPVFYRNISDTLLVLLTSEDDTFSDTVRIALPSEKSGRKRSRVPSLNLSQGLLASGADLILRFPVWMDTASFRSSAVRIQTEGDSLSQQLPAQMSWADGRTLVLRSVYEEDRKYLLRVDTGMVHDWLGNSNDSVHVFFSRTPLTELSKLILNLVVPFKQAYVVQLLNQQDAVVAERSFAVSLSATNELRFEFGALAPGNYKVKLVFDDNANGKWDTGSLLLRRQPERVHVSTKEIKLLADWEVEERVEVRSDMNKN